MNYFNYLVVILMFASIFINAQPTITYEGNAPQIGDIFYQSYSQDYVNPGPQGPNKIWNFSDISVFETGEYEALDPSDTPFADYFTDANIAFNYLSRSGTYNYDLITSTEANNLGMGFDDSPSMIIYYNNAAKLIEYPFAFNDNFTDTYSGSYQLEGMFVNQNGTIEKIADAWGTITTPAGTFENVLRLKTTRNEIDSFWMDDLFLWRSITIFKDYEWYTSNSRSPVFAISISSGAVETDTISYFSTGMTNINNISQQSGNLHMYPNPAKDFVKLFYTPQKGDKISIVLIDLTGREVIREETAASSSTLSYILNLDGISPGIYFIRVTEGELSSSQKVLIR